MKKNKKRIMAILSIFFCDDAGDVNKRFSRTFDSSG